jgi:alcohol dehydrogenase (NADP+)
VVSAVGPEVSKYQVGDHVGVGCMVNSCGNCSSCKAGLEQYCKPGATFTYNSIDKDGTSTHGGYSQAVVVDENFVVRIPVSLPLDKAAPLLCAGITLFSPLRHWKAGPDTRLAIIGLGGLGHMGVKLGAAMGADVTVLSQSLKKMEDGLRLGASHYYATADPDTFRNLRGGFDLILNTVSANLKLGDYLNLLDVDGTLVELGIPEHPMEVRHFRWRWRAAACPDRTSVGSPRPRRCWTSAPSTTSRPKSSSSNRITSMRRTSACWQATCATAS